MKQWIKIVSESLWAWLCIATLFVVMPVDAQEDHSPIIKHVIRLQVQGLLYSHWGDFKDAVTNDGCTNPEATSIYLPDTIDCNGHNYVVMEIGPSAYENHKQLQRMNCNVDNMLVHAFTGCENLRVLVLRSSKPRLIGKHIFYYGTPNEVFDDYHFLTCAVVVPPGSVQDCRQAHGWRKFHTIIDHEPTRDDYDLTGIASRIAELEHERDSLADVARQLRNSLAAVTNDLAAVTDDLRDTTAAPTGNVAPSTKGNPYMAMADSLTPTITQSVEHYAIKILSGEFEFKSRFSPEIIIHSHPDTMTVHLVVPDSVTVNDRPYPVTQMCDDLFADHGHLLTLTLPAGLTNVSPGAFARCRELRLLELRSPVPPAFRSIDDGDCSPHEVLSDSQCARLTLVVPPGSEQAYRNAPGWRRCSRITTARPTLAGLGLSPTDEQRINVDAQLCRIAVRQSHISTALRALRSRLETSP